MCHLPDKGRREIEEIVKQMQEKDRGERKMNESEETEEIKTFILYPYLLQGQQALPNCKPVSVEPTGCIRYTTPLPHPTMFMEKKKNVNTFWFGWKKKSLIWSVSWSTIFLGPVVQSIISLTSWLVVKMLAVLVSIIFNLQLILLKKMWLPHAFLLQMQKLFTFFQQKKISIYAIFNNKSFRHTLTNGIISFEQLGLRKLFLDHELCSQAGIQTCNPWICSQMHNQQPYYEAQGPVVQN